MKIITIIGARPQFIKAATISRIVKKYNITEILVHTGQHYDNNLSNIFFKELEIPQPKYNLGIGSGNHGKQTAGILQKLEPILINETPDYLIVYGDTNSTIAAAMCAAKLLIPVVHIEAGLRSLNRLMPEEINRIATDHISEILFAPTLNAMKLLGSEGLENKSEFSGDVMFDSILYYKEKVDRCNLPEIIKNKEYYLATVHRAENTNSKERLTSIFAAFDSLDRIVILPLHPRTKKYLEKYKINAKNVHFIDPVGYKEMISLMKYSTKVLTDSGGLQKEAFFLEKPCITLRDETEWIETKQGDWNQIVGADKNKIISALKNNPKSHKPIEQFGDGMAAEKILEYLLENFNEKN